MSPTKDSLTTALAALRAVCMTYPEVVEEFPWGHSAMKVKGKSFVFMAIEKGVLSISVKLPDSRDFALSMPFAAPTGYNLGKSGWVTSTFAPGSEVPVDLLGVWIDESFRSIAPKRLSATLPSLGGTVAAKPSGRRSKR